MYVFCDVITAAGNSAPMIPAVEGRTFIVTAIRIQNESTTDVTAILYSSNKEGSKARSRICMPSKGIGYDRVYEKGRELRSTFGGDFTLSLSVAASVGVTIEGFYQ